MTPTATTERLTAPERREQILEAAVTVFAERGYEGASTDVIARMAGISQPYLFRLFGTKRELIIATIKRCFEDTESLFRAAANGLDGRGGAARRSGRRTSRRSAQPAQAARAAAVVRGVRRPGDSRRRRRGIRRAGARSRSA